MEFFEVSLESCMTPQATKFFPTTPPPIKVIFYVTPLGGSVNDSLSNMFLNDDENRNGKSLKRKQMR